MTPSVSQVLLTISLNHSCLTAPSSSDPHWYICGYHGKAQNLVSEQWWEKGHLKEYAIYQLRKRNQIQTALTSLSLMSISANLRIARCSSFTLSLFKKVTVKNRPFYLLRVQWNTHFKYLGISQRERVEPQGMQGFSPGPVVSFPLWSSELCQLENLVSSKRCPTQGHRWQPAGVQKSSKGLALDHRSLGCEMTTNFHPGHNLGQQLLKFSEVQ